MASLRAPILFTAIAATFLASPAFAALTPSGSGMKAYFGSQGTLYTDANPPAAFTPPPIGPYPAGVGSPLPAVPAPPTSPVFPGTYGIPFAGGGALSTFSDPLLGTANTSAVSIIDDFYNPAGTSTADVNITIPLWFFNQGTTAPSYAYQQINFVDQYTSNLALAASTPVFPIFISGAISPGGTPYVQFDAAMTYSWIDIQADGTLGGTTTLGTLCYTWQSNTPGPFTATVNNTGSLIATPTGGGVLEITGYAYISGDPFYITVSTVPEPASLALLTLGALSLLRRRHR